MNAKERGKKIYDFLDVEMVELDKDPAWPKHAVMLGCIPLSLMEPNAVYAGYGCTGKEEMIWGGDHFISKADMFFEDAAAEPFMDKWDHPENDKADYIFIPIERIE